MIVNVKQFGADFGLPPGAEPALLQAEEALCRCIGADWLAERRERLFAEDPGVWPELDRLAERAGLHPFAAHLLFLIFCLPETKKRYEAAGLPEALYWDSVKDLRYKMEETEETWGVWGVRCGPWLANFLLLKCFCLGRLQFELLPIRFPCRPGGRAPEPGDTVVNVHIPSFGKLDYGAVMDAYRRAAEFFRDAFPDGAVWFHCESWLLYPPVRDLFPEGNLRRFAADYRVIETHFDPQQDDRFRVFQRPASVPMAEYPEDTSLQRRLKPWLLEGNTMGIGVGVFRFENGEIAPL